MDIYELDSYRLSDAVKFHTELNPALWDGKTMRPEVREALLKIADDFKTFMGIDDLAVEDITVSGSNAAFSYTPHSDIDLHLIVDFSKLNPDDVYQELFNAKKYQYNDTHDIKIRGYDVELYVQDSNKPVRSLGEYSIVNNDWNRIPVQRRGNLDEKSTQQKYEKLKKLIELAMASDDLTRVTHITDTLKKYRQAGLDQHGEFGPENLAYKILRTQGYVERLFAHRADLEDAKLSLAERKKKKTKKKKTFKYGSFGGYYYPGYHYYGQTDAAADGGGDGGGEDIEESVETKVKVQAREIPIEKVVRRFVHFAQRKLGLKKLPRIVLRGEEFSKNVHSFGHYVDDDHKIEVATHGRHIMDIMRTLAHELVHYRQHQQLGTKMPDTAGRTGSPYENEAHAKAGVIMRHFQNKYPEFFGAETVAEDGDSVAAQYGDQTPPGPEFKPTMPAGTVRVDVSDVYDWYKLGQHIANMKGLGHHDFGAGPPSTIVSFGSEDEEHKFIQDLEKTGLDVTDIDPRDPKPRPGRKIKTDPTYDVDEGLGKALGTAAVAGAMALGSPAAKSQDAGSIAYQIGKQIYQPSGIFTRAGAEEELKGIARELARGNTDIRIGGRRVFAGPQARGERVAANGVGSSPAEAYQDALNRAYTEANRRYGPIAVGDWQLVTGENEVQRVGGQYQAAVVIQGTKPLREVAWSDRGRKIQARQQEKIESRKFVYQGYTIEFTPNAVEIRHGPELKYRKEGDFKEPTKLNLAAARRLVDMLVRQYTAGNVQENASGYIPTKKQARDPRFKTALTVDIRPGQVGKEANKLGLQTDSQGRPDLLMKNLANALKEYKETGVFEAVNPVTPVPHSRAPKTEYPPMVKQKTNVPQDKPRPRPDGTGRIIDYEVREDQDLLEVKMSPSALEAWANSPEAQGIRAGFEAEMIFRDTKRDDDDGEMEPDYDYDERPDDIEHVIDFFSYDEYGYGLGGRDARDLRETLYEEFREWQDDKIADQWEDAVDDQVRDYMETNVWGDDSEREDRIRAKVEDMFPDDDADDIMAAGDAAPRFTRSSDQETYVNENDLYAKYKEASDAAYEDFEAEVISEIENRGDNYDAAREYYWDMMRDSGDYDERDFLRDQYGWMTDIANSNDLYWPYMMGGGSGGGDRDWDDIADSLRRTVGMEVKVGSGYHSTTRKDDRWIIEPDGSLDPDDSDDMGLEIVSPPMPLPQALEKLKAVIEWGNNKADAYTNSSTGLHMGVSIPYVGGDVDYVKLVLFMGDEYVLDKFGRASNTYAASAMGKLRQNMAGARNRGELTEAKLDPMGALELVQKNLIELAARYVQNGVGTSKYTSAHIKDGYIEFRSPGGDYLSMESRGEYDDIKNTMLRFARAMQIAGSPSLERKEYAKKLYKLISPGAQDDGLKLFSQFAAGTITPEQLKKQWADAVLQKEIPTTGKVEYEVYDADNARSPDGVIDTFYARNYDDAYDQYQKKYISTSKWTSTDVRAKQPWFDVFDEQDNVIATLRARDVDQAREKAKVDNDGYFPDTWKIYRRPDNTPEPEKKLSPRAQVAKRIKQPKVTAKVAADNAQDSKDIQARIGEPQPAGAVGDTGHYRVTWDERRGDRVVSDALNIDAPNADAAMDRVRDALQLQGRDIVQIAADAQQPPAWRDQLAQQVRNATPRANFELYQHDTPDVVFHSMDNATTDEVRAFIDQQERQGMPPGFLRVRKV